MSVQIKAGDRKLYTKEELREWFYQNKEELAAFTEDPLADVFFHGFISGLLISAMTEDADTYSMDAIAYIKNSFLNMRVGMFDDMLKRSLSGSIISPIRGISIADLFSKAKGSADEGVH